MHTEGLSTEALNTAVDSGIIRQTMAITYWISTAFTFGARTARMNSENDFVRQVIHTIERLADLGKFLLAFTIYAAVLLTVHNVLFYLTIKPYI